MKYIVSALIMSRCVIDKTNANKIVECYMSSNKGYFKPTHYGEEENTLEEIKMTDLKPLYKLIENGFIFMERKGNIKWKSFIDNFSIDIRRNLKNKHNSISIYFSDDLIKEAEIYESFIELFRLLSECFDADYSRVTYELPKVQRPVKLVEYVDDIHWLNFFGNIYIDLIGRDRLLNAPCYKTSETKNGIILQATKDPDETKEIRYEKIKKEIKSHLGNELFKSGKRIIRGWKAPQFDI